MTKYTVEDGLTADCAQAAVEGLLAGGVEANQVNLNRLEIGMYQACDRGWGTGKEAHYCQVEDGFQTMHKRTCQVDALALETLDV